MKIEKGKLYIHNGVVEMPMTDMDVEDGLYSNRIAVRCPTKEDWEYIVSKGYTLTKSFYESADYGLYSGTYRCKKESYHFITIEEFKKFYPVKINNMIEKNLKITKEQAEELLRTTPALSEVIYNSFPELKPRPTVLDSWEDLKHISGFYVTTNSNIHDCTDTQATKVTSNTFFTEDQAKSALAYAQLTQLMAATGDCDIDWGSNTYKRVIIRKGNQVEGDLNITTFAPIAFNTAKVRDAFLEKHMELLKQYFQIK